MLGPARFSHIKTGASEVCQEFKRMESLRECISTLSTLDVILAELRSAYNAPADSGKHEPNQQAAPVFKDYSTLDLAKGKRLIKARKSAIKSLKLLLSKRRKGQSTDNLT
jgi:hypothetical protein